MTYLSSNEFKALAKTKSITTEKVRKDYPATVTEIADRTLKFTISTSDVDRSGDVIDQSGWLLANYVNNPVVLVFHDARRLPVGKCIDILIEDEKLKATVEFVPADVPIAGEMAEAVYQLCKNGFLSATSVGFLPVAWEFASDPARPDGVDFQVSELVEFSIVPIPDNPFALIEPQSEPDSVKEATDINTGRNARARRKNVIRLLALR